MASNVIPFLRRAANDNPHNTPPFDPENAVHVRAWRDMYEYGLLLKRRMEGGR